MCKRNWSRYSFERDPGKRQLYPKIFGCESAIAYKNMKRNKYGYKATIRALALGILLFLLTGGLSGQAKEFQEWMTPKSKEMMVDYSSNYDIEVNAKTGKEERKSAGLLHQTNIMKSHKSWKSTG